MYIRSIAYLNLCSKFSCKIFFISGCEENSSFYSLYRWLQWCRSEVLLRECKLQGLPRSDQADPGHAKGRDLGPWARVSPQSQQLSEKTSTENTEWCWLSSKSRNFQFCLIIASHVIITVCEKIPKSSPFVLAMIIVLYIILLVHTSWKLVKGLGFISPW